MARQLLYDILIDSMAMKDASLVSVVGKSNCSIAFHTMTRRPMMHLLT